MIEKGYSPSLGSYKLGVAQRGNLRYLEDEIRKHWGLGQNIVLCWCPVPSGVLLLFAPHYFLGQFTDSLNAGKPADRLEELNGSFIRKLISGDRKMEEDDFYSTARRFEITPTFVKLPVPIVDESSTWQAVEELIQRYSISYVESRAVLLFDIVDFSLYSPFEQASQLNSLSYSLNSAYNKMLKRKVKINFARTTTGDGFYIWNRDKGLLANAHLFQFMLLVVADNALAKRKSQSNTVPDVRTGFHIGSHYEFYQAEGLDPTMYSYIVGDVTIELARMLENAKSGQVYVGDFRTQLPTSAREEAYIVDVDTVQFVERVSKKLNDYSGVELAGEKTEKIYVYVTGETGASGGETPKKYLITDKHGKTRYVYNLRINIYRQDLDPIILGMQGKRIGAGPKPLRMPRQLPRIRKAARVTLPGGKRF
jgi:hypothetical protein